MIYRRELLSLGVFALLPQVRARAQGRRRDSSAISWRRTTSSRGRHRRRLRTRQRPSPANRERFLLSRSMAPELVTAADILGVRPGRRADRCPRQDPVQGAVHPQRDLPRAAGRQRRRALPRAVADSVRRDEGAAAADVSPERVSRRRRAGVRDSRGRRHDEHARRDGAARRARSRSRSPTSPPC